MNPALSLVPDSIQHEHVLRVFMKSYLSCVVLCMVSVLSGCAGFQQSSSGNAVTPDTVVTRSIHGTELVPDPVLTQVENLTRAGILYDVKIMESYPVQIEATGPDKVLTCLASPNGRWLQEQQECEFMTAKSCTMLGGRFNECVSACRHESGEVMCIQMCVPVCSFSGK